MLNSMLLTQRILRVFRFLTEEEREKTKNVVDETSADDKWSFL